MLRILRGSYSRRLAFAAAAIAAAGAVAACGSDAVRDDGRSDSSAPPEQISAYDGALTNEFNDGFESGEADAPAAKADTASGAWSGDAPGTLPSVLDRKIIMTASFSLETDDVTGGFEEIGRIAFTYGGFVASSSFGAAGEFPTAAVTIRVPAENYQRAVSDLRTLGEVKDFDSSSSDVTEEFTDLESRLRGLRAVEAQYMDFLSRAQTIDEVLTVQDRLNGVRVEMEQIQGRMNLLNNQTDLATITAHLAPPPVGPEPVPDDGTTTPLEALENGWEASLALLSGVAVVALAVLAFSWWLIPVAIVVAFIVRRLARAAGTGAPPPAAAPQPPAAT